MEAFLWFGLFIVLLVIEIITLGLTTIWFAGGALVAFIASVLGMPLAGQFVLFLAVSFLMLYFTRPWAVKYVNKNRAKTNIDSLIGKTAVVQEEINNLKAQGKVILNGMEWTARGREEQSVIQKGALVEVLEINGVKLIVREMKEDK